jgi:hypothetical protein
MAIPTHDAYVGKYTRNSLALSKKKIVLLFSTFCRSGVSFRENS